MKVCFKCLVSTFNLRLFCIDCENSIHVLLNYQRAAAQPLEAHNAAVLRRLRTPLFSEGASHRQRLRDNQSHSKRNQKSETAKINVHIKIKYLWFPMTNGYAVVALLFMYSNGSWGLDDKMEIFSFPHFNLSLFKI